MSQKYLWSFYWDYGRSGSLDGLFVATEEAVNEVIGQEAYFGEVLGKHSEVYGDLSEGDISKIDISPDAVEEVSRYLGTTWSGFNPLEYVRFYCHDCGERIHVGDGELYSHDEEGNVICHEDDNCPDRTKGDDE